MHSVPKASGAKLSDTGSLGKPHLEANHSIPADCPPQNFRKPNVTKSPLLELPLRTSLPNCPGKTDLLRVPDTQRGRQLVLGPAAKGHHSSTRPPYGCQRGSHTVHLPKHQGYKKEFSPCSAASASSNSDLADSPGAGWFTGSHPYDSRAGEVYLRLFLHTYPASPELHLS